MKKIDLYILREFLTTFIIVSIFFTLISLIVDVFENLNRFIDNEVSANILFDYYKASLPSMVSVTIPVSCLVSSVFTYGMMIQRKEWLVFKSSGLSLYRLSTRFNSNNNVAVNLNFLELEDGMLLKRIDSKKAIWSTELNQWNLKDFSIRDFDRDGLEKNVIISKNDSLITLNFAPSDIINTASSSEEVSYSELKNQIQSLKNNGVNTLKWEVDLNYKIAYSFISIIVIFCGIPLSVYRSNTTLAFGGGLSLATIFSYVILLKFGQSLAYGGVLSPFFGAWMSNFVFISIGIYLMLNARK